MNLKSRILMIFFGLISAIIFAQANQTTNYLNTSNPLEFDGQLYYLVETYHPNENYYKQEYIANNERPEKFKTLITIDFLRGNFKLKDVVNYKIKELKKIKEFDPIVDYALLESKDGFILDFLIAQYGEPVSFNGKNTSARDLLFVERNVYRYKLIKNKKDKVKGILLFAISKRAYENEITSLFETIKENRANLIEKVENCKVPEIKIEK